MAITTTLILDAVKRGVTMPANQVRFTDADLLKFADEETESLLLPILTSIRQEFLVKKKLQTCVASTAEYKIPYRAVGRTLRDLNLARTSDESIIRPLDYITPEDAAMRYPSTQTGEPLGFTVQGDSVVLIPAPASTQYSLLFSYLLKPSYLVPVASAGVITGVDTVTGVVTIGSAISAFTSGATMDLVDGKSGCSVLAEDVVNTNVASTLITFDPDDLPTGLAAGDYVTLSNQTPVMQLPDELHQSLVQAVICRVLEALGDTDMLAAAQAKLDKKIEAAEKLLTPRVEGKIPVILGSPLLNRPLNRYRSNL